MEELMFGASTTMGFEDRSLGALFCILNMGEIVKEYESEREKLISNRDIVQRKVDTNDNRRQRVNVAVFKWLQDVDKLMEEDRKMEIEMESQSKNCFLWTFFAEDNYHIYDGMQKKMMVLNIKCVFQPFSIHIPSEDVVIESSSSNYLLQQVARNVCLECRGLPLTIEDVGKSLRGRPIEEWKESLDTLRHTSARYQIFLSFRGFDTRYSFTGFLYQALCRERFKVKPKDVRNGTGSFGLAMVGHETKFGKDSERVKNWKLALSKVGGMAGKPYTNGSKPPPPCSTLHTDTISFCVEPSIFRCRQYTANLRDPFALLFQTHQNVSLFSNPYTCYRKFY
ncbi:hypothetical protein RJT34_10926 [Clitoria ternatea]|uniref:TIR domain-containing protein n=1 Tax=Clitoria ternatea TaxID=43366 RepID=A0AAN9PJ32_CLITE